MLRKQSLSIERLLLLAMLIVLSAAVTSCHRDKAVKNVDVTAKTSISGTVNGSPIEVNVTSTFNTGRGGSSSCEFTKLPTGFNPASLGTHT